MWVRPTLCEQLTRKALSEMEQSCAKDLFSRPGSQFPSRDFRSFETVPSQSDAVLSFDAKYTATGILNRPQTTSRTTALNTFSKVIYFFKRLTRTFTLSMLHAPYGQPFGEIIYTTYDASPGVTSACNHVLNHCHMQRCAMHAIY